VGLFLGRETRQAFPEPPIPPFYGSDASGMVSPATKPDTALTVPTVWACVNLLAGTVSQMPLETFRKLPDPSAVPRRVEDPKWLTIPDAGMTLSEWLYMAMVSMLLRGNVYGLIMRDGLGYAKGIHLLNPDSVKVEADRTTGRVVYRYTHSNKVIPSDDMWHVRGLTMPGAVVGLSPISYAAAVLGLDISSRQFANGFFEGGGIPKAVLESDQQVNQEQARTIKDRVMATFRGREPLVLGLGLKYTQIQVKPEESQFLATQNANVSTIAKFFGVPAAMVDGPSGHGMTYTNTQSRGLDFLTYSVGHWLKRFEDAMYGLLPGSQYVKFNPAVLLRTDTHTQSQVDLLDLAGKIVTPSEIRARRGLDPMTEAQKAEADMVPLSVGPLGRPVGLPALHDPVGPVAPVPATENPTGV
jgi:HK97 family phage portal protein